MIDSIKDLGTNPGKPKATDNSNTNKVSELKKMGEASAGTGDNVQLSDDALKLESIARGLSDLPDVNVAKVEALKAQVESGEYRINFENLAQRIQDSFAE